MKLRSFILIAIFTLLLAACNYTLAEDVTPPPGYVPPTPMPTLVLSPAQAPNVENGKAIYAEKCAACHGETGMGDGPQGIQLGVTVPAFGLPEIARPASPAEWLQSSPAAAWIASCRRSPASTISSVGCGRLPDPAHHQEQAAKGKEIFETNCKDCSTDFFKDQRNVRFV